MHEVRINDLSFLYQSSLSLTVSSQSIRYSIILIPVTIPNDKSEVHCPNIFNFHIQLILPLRKDLKAPTVK